MVFKNAKYTGEYNDKFEGFTDIELEKREEGYVLIIKQEQSYFLIFFDMWNLKIIIIIMGNRTFLDKGL